MLDWAIAAGNIFVWTWTVLQWNCMARAVINIDPLALHNFRRGQVDSIVARYDNAKPDQDKKGGLPVPSGNSNDGNNGSIGNVGNHCHW
mmetsp:Transcript_30556/g.67151  ORF Transcript_30556/g.67151 Transcript_30556/m.67151 type:complete len:89 (-) Transcript_30556:185-451(-)